MGLSIAEQFGEDAVKYYFLMSKCWFKTLFCCCTIFTCCCCFFCCCCCCGRCKTQQEDEYFMDPEDLEADFNEQEAARDHVVINQPRCNEDSAENTTIVLQPMATNGTSSPGETRTMALSTVD
ncbi:PREDICTED: dnaJ homolog subfamily C member 5-like [Cyprinodon variegatus]|uniref:dnaJ homolog subfamily C member 5-like n=1 Tax=Cyprinodon variegatus TaxID=28743 RepID=UPI0007428A96|nr:PREDICTED: dnaJ homolog subfamily C member 5-like [Cyprinodon variegatus]XP_015241067.1 PREDICTED: dnaJ homolog subfamily C member 5-like [Cyprinodon variegatus]